MIRGRFLHDECIIPVSVRGPSGAVAHVMAVIDTGYNQVLTLKPEIIQKLELIKDTEAEAELGDGSIVRHDRYFAAIEWLGKVHQVSVDESQGDILLGIELLRNCELTIQVRNGGEVTIRLLKKKGK